MKATILLHLYQPSYQDPAIFKQVASESYIPLLRFLKENRGFKMSLDVPISLLHQMKLYGYISWIDDLKTLINREQIELVGSAAYHPLLTKLPDALVEEQIILNEIGLSSLLGSSQDFEGEDALMLKNLRGFFPPELAVNENLVNILSSLNYSWVVVDPSSVDTSSESESGVFESNGDSCLLVSRNSMLSDVVAFCRDSSFDFTLLNSKSPVIIVIDGETFGHHNIKGISLLYNLFKYANKNNIAFETVSEYVNNSVSAKTSVKESTWASNNSLQSESDLYTHWVSDASEINKLAWDIYNIAVKLVERRQEDLISSSNVQEARDYYQSSVKGLKEPNIVLIHKMLASDMFWWSSNTIVADTTLYNPESVARALSLYTTFLELLPLSDEKESLIKLINDTLSALKNPN